MRLFLLLGFLSVFLLSSINIFAQEDILDLFEKNQNDVYKIINKNLEDNGGIRKLYRVNKKYNALSSGRAESLLSVKLAIQPTYEDKLREAERLVSGELKEFKDRITHLADIHLSEAPIYSPRYTVFMLKLKEIFPHLKFVHHIHYKDPIKFAKEGYDKTEPLTPDLTRKWPLQMEQSSYNGCDPFQTFTDTYINEKAINEVIKNFNTGNSQDEEEKKKIPYFLLHLGLINYPSSTISEIRSIVENEKDRKLTFHQRFFKEYVFPLSDAIRDKKDLENIKAIVMKIVDAFEKESSLEDSSSEDTTDEDTTDEDTFSEDSSSK